MEWLNLPTSVLHAPEYIGSEPVARATWTNVCLWCAQQENGGRIPGAADWNDRRWQQTCGVMRSEIDASAPLLVWDGSDLAVWRYPEEKELEVRAKREAGKRTALLRWGTANKSANSTANSCVDSSAISSADAEGKVSKQVSKKGGSGEPLPDSASPVPAVLSVEISEKNQAGAPGTVPISGELPLGNTSIAAKEQNALKSKRGPKLTDSEWIAELKVSDAYKGIDIDREHAKCIVWCREHRKQPTRARLINWLNKCEQPLGAFVARPAALVHEPAGWKPFLNEEFPDSRFAYNQVDEAREWSDLDSSTQKWLVGQMRARGLL